jgi:hypothetical protein
VTAAAEGALDRASIPHRRKHPSAGFVAVCATYIGVATFLSWGLSTHVLDRAWTLHHELKLGLRGAPRDGDVPRLRDALERYPGLASALLSEGEIGLISAERGGWLETPEATIVRTADAKKQLMRIEVGTPLDLLPFAIHVDGEGFEQRLHAKDHGVLEVTLPAARGHAELIVLRLKGKKLRADPSVLNVRVTFAEAGAP